MQARSQLHFCVIDVAVQRFILPSWF